VGHSLLNVNVTVTCLFHPVDCDRGRLRHSLNPIENQYEFIYLPCDKQLQFLTILTDSNSECAKRIDGVKQI